MREGERSDNIYVVVDSSKIARCKWCGLVESHDWVRTSSGIFCSKGCALADSGPGLLLTAVLLGGFSPVFFAMAIMMHVIIPFIGYLAMLGIGSLVLVLGTRGMAQRTSVPKNSRTNDVPLGTGLLTTVSTSVICPRCDAELDLWSISKDRVYVCSYCGATGTVSIIDRSEPRRSDGS